MRNGQTSLDKKVWLWERDTGIVHYGKRPMTKAQCRVFFASTWHRLGRLVEELPDIIFVTRETADAETHMFIMGGRPHFLILLPSWARSKETILHELAHVLTDCEGHTVVFVECYISLLSSLTSRAAAPLIESARAYTIDVEPEKILHL